MTRRQRRERNHQRREQERQRQAGWGQGMRCAHCGHRHAAQQDKCRNCRCTDFDH
jgi:hypothetical protein